MENSHREEKSKAFVCELLKLLLDKYIDKGIYEVKFEV